MHMCICVFASTQMWKEQNITSVFFLKCTSGNFKLSKRM